MAGTIASASLMLTTDSGGLNKGLDAATKKVTSWGKKTEEDNKKTGKESGKKLGKGMGEALEDEGKKGKGKTGKEGWGSMIMSGLTSVVSAIPGIVGAVIGGAVAIGSAFSSISEGMLKTTKAARELGVGLLGFSALEAAAKVTGVATEDLQGAVQALQGNLEMADGPAQKLFGQLGLDVQKLRDMPVDEATATIADALQKIQDPGERARLSLAVFGEKALAITPLLNKGGAEIRRMADAAKASGEAFDEMDAAKVTAASEAMAKLSGIWSGFCNWLAISVAGLVEWGATALSSIGSACQSIGSWFADLGSTISTWGASTWDSIVEATGTVWEEVQPYWDAFLEYVSPVWDTICEYAVSAWDTISTASIDALEGMGVDTKAWGETIGGWIDTVKGWFSGLWDYVSSMWDWIFGKKKGGDALVENAKQIADMAAGATGAGGSSGSSGSGLSLAAAGERDARNYGRGFQRGLTRVSAEVLKGMNDLEKELTKAMATVGMTGAEGKIWEFGQKGASKEQLAKLKDMAQAAKEVDAGWSVIEVPPLEMWERQLAGLDRMLESGRITWEQYAQGVAKAGKQMQAAAGVGELKTTGAAFMGSGAAMSAQIKAELQDRIQNDPAAEMRRAQKELAEVQKRQLRVAEQMLAEMQRQNEEEWAEI